MKRILFCTACGSPLSKAVTLVNGNAPGVAQPKLEGAEPAVAQGTAFEAHGTVWMVQGDTPDPLDPPQVWVNLGDLLGARRYTPHELQLQGCCGLDGLDGLNRLCACGAHVGTEMSDCWTPHMFLPDAGATEWRDEGEGA